MNSFTLRDERDSRRIILTAAAIRSVPSPMVLGGQQERDLNESNGLYSTAATRFSVPTSNESNCF